MMAATANQVIRDSRLVAIPQGSSVDRLAAGAQVLVEEGVQPLEFPLTSPDALDAIQQAVEAIDGQAMVGTGTVRTVENTQRARAKVDPLRGDDVLR
jgi:2-keto-3-deoxy-6-phosphogluconate aldolase